TVIRETINRAFNTDSRSLRPLTGRTVLDVGCGGGLVTEPLARLGGTVMGIDPGHETVQVAATHAGAVGLDIAYRAATADEIAAEGRTFDLVTCLEVLEHVPEPEALVGTLASLVAPGGCLILSTINRTAKSYALAIVGAEMVLRWLPRGTHDWNRFIAPEELANWVEGAGLAILDRTGTVFDPLSGTWAVSHSDLDVNYMVAAISPPGKPHM
ncbi:MAG: bifunctional 2-polyprenyl-6-hydroxyphenol methylase/3-demethylubiquinol 3-O-methyltransferase UbiG, partial [Hyphomicrobiaceae bacterium]